MDRLWPARRCTGAPELRPVPRHPAAVVDGVADADATRLYLGAGHAGDPVARPPVSIRAGPLALERRDPPGDLPDVRVPPRSRLRVPHLEPPPPVAEPEAGVHARRAILRGVGVVRRTALLDHSERQLRGGALSSLPRAGADGLAARDTARTGRPAGPEDAAPPPFPLQRVAHHRLAGAHGRPGHRHPRRGGSWRPTATRARRRRSAGGAAQAGARVHPQLPGHRAGSLPRSPQGRHQRGPRCARRQGAAPHSPAARGKRHPPRDRAAPLGRIPDGRCPAGGRPAAARGSGRRARYRQWRRRGGRRRRTAGDRVVEHPGPVDPPVRSRLRARGRERPRRRPRGADRAPVPPGARGVAGRDMTERIRALVVDDEPAARAAIRALLADDPEIHVVGECADGRTAFDVHALDYLLKPFDDERFRRAVAHAKQQVRQGKLGALSDRLVALLDGVGRPPAVTRNGQYLKRLAIKAGGRVTILGVRDIVWNKAEDEYVKIHAGRAWHLLRETMKHLEAQFDPARFVRIHRSTIVNVERIKELQPYFRGEYVVILHDGTSLKLSRGYKEHLEAALGRSF